MSRQFDYDLIAIGSGPAGQRAAVQAAKLNKRAAVVEKGRISGGVCVDTGTIPSKTFREAVLAFGRLDPRVSPLGEGSHRTRPSMDRLLEKVQDVVQMEAEIVDDQLQRNEVDVLRGRARFEDVHTLRIDSPGGTRRVTAGHILIACGTRPAQPRGFSLDGEVIVTSDDIIKLPQLPRNLVVVGGGVIGIEYASMFARLGVEVSILDRRERPLEFLDHEIVDEMIHQMRNAKVNFCLGDGVERMEVTDGPGRKAVIFLESGKRLVTDIVLFSVGRVGATDDLDLDRAGLEADERGRLTVDADFRTSVPHIYAAGDVIGYPSLAATSYAQGRYVACKIFGKETCPLPEHLPIGIYSMPQISMVGHTERQLSEMRIPYEVGIARYREIARGQILGDDSGFFKMLFNRDDRKLLGVHIIGTDATELLHIGQAVLNFGGTMDYFIDTIFNYPTLAECYKVAAFDASNKIAQVESLEYPCAVEPTLGT